MAQLLSRIAEGESQMTPDLLAFWQDSRIAPVKWSLHPWGDQGGGFWAVSIVGQQVVWFNDIEDGFNSSTFESYGHIKEYWCDQLDLYQCMYRIFTELSGQPRLPRCGPPEAIPEFL